MPQTLLAAPSLIVFFAITQDLNGVTSKSVEDALPAQQLERENSHREQKVIKQKALGSRDGIFVHLRLQVEEHHFDVNAPSWLVG